MKMHFVSCYSSFCIVRESASCPQLGRISLPLVDMHTGSVLLLVSAVLLPFVNATKTPPSNLQIGVRRRPEDCAVRSQAGDVISVHYTVGYMR